MGVALKGEDRGHGPDLEHRQRKKCMQKGGTEGFQEKKVGDLILGSKRKKVNYG